MSSITATATKETATKQDWYSPECQREMIRDFELILTFSHEDALVGLAALRQAFDRDAMTVAARQLPLLAKKKLSELVKELSIDNSTSS